MSIIKISKCIFSHHDYNTNEIFKGIIINFSCESTKKFLIEFYGFFHRKIAFVFNKEIFLKIVYRQILMYYYKKVINAFRKLKKNNFTSFVNVQENGLRI